MSIATLTMTTKPPSASPPATDRKSNDDDATLPAALPILPPPPKESFLRKYVGQPLLLYGVVNTIVVVAMPLLIATKKLTLPTLRELFSLVWRSTFIQSIKDVPEYQDEALLRQVYAMPGARPYVERNALEWQLREGFCGRATMRCMLKSLDGVPLHLIPEPKFGESNPEKWIAALPQLEQDDNATVTLSTEIVRPGGTNDEAEDYQAFLATLRKVNGDPNTRIAINFLRSALFGFKNKLLWWIPVHFMLTLFGGHFSPVIGLLERPDGDPLVAIFDVNHNYNGAYLVAASRLYQSVQARDISNGKCRALIVVKSTPTNAD